MFIEDDIEVYIPMKDGEVNVKVSLKDYETVEEILLSELPLLNIWIYISITYYMRSEYDKTEKLLHLLADGKNNEVNEEYKDDLKGKIMVLCYLSSYYSVLAFNSKDDTGKKEELYNKAILYSSQVNELERKTDQSSLSWVCRGYQYLFKKDKENPQQEFTNALKKKSNCLPVLIGMACLFYRSGDYQSALGQYKQALQSSPNCPASVRVGIGLCNYKLNNIEFAKKAFERALAIDPNNVDALACLAMLKKSNVKGDRKNNYKEVHDLLNKSYQLNHKNLLVLSQLADYLFFYSWTQGGGAKVVNGSNKIITTSLLSDYIVKGHQIRLNNVPYRVKEIKEDTIILESSYTGETSNNVEVTYKNYKKVIDLALNSTNYTDDDHIKGESYYFIARAYHIMGDYNSATAYYTNSANLKFELAYYGLAQMAYYKGELREAKAHLHTLLQYHPECTEAREFYGIIVKSLKADTDEFIKILKAEPNHINALIYHASYLMKSPYTKVQQEACKTFEKAIQLSEQRNKPILFEVLFNVAALYHKLKDYNNSEFYYQRAIKQYCDKNNIEIDNKEYSHLLREELISVAYNYALLKESLGEWEKLNESLDDIENICSIMGTNDEIKTSKYKMECYKKAQLMKYKILTIKNMTNDAKQVLNKLLELNKIDSYLLLEKANFHFQNAGTQARYVNGLMKAAEGYKEALKCNKYNVYTVNGLAMILAEQGLLNEASNLFQIIKESIREVPSSYFNQAIIMRAQGKTQDSIEAMKSYIKRFNNPTNYEPYLYLARALYDNKQFKELITIYTKCIQMDPTNIKLWYNLAIAHTQYAAFIITVEKVHMLEFDEVKGVYPCCGREKGEEGCTTSRQRTVQEVASAVNSMITARDLFQWLYDEYDTFPNPPYQKKTAEAYFNSCSQNIEPAKAHLDYEIKQNEQLLREKQIYLTLEKEREAQRIEKEEEEKRLKEERRKEEEERFKEEHKRFLEEMAKIKSENGDDNNEENNERKSRKRNKKESVNKDYDEIFGDEDEIITTSKKQKRRKEKKGNESSEEENELLTSDEDDDDDDKLITTVHKRRLVKSNTATSAASNEAVKTGPVFSDDEIFSDDDEDDEKLIPVHKPEVNSENNNVNKKVDDKSNVDDEDEDLFGDDAEEEKTESENKNDAEKRKASDDIDGGEVKKAKVDGEGNADIVAEEDLELSD